jgi:exodeoxyribonuclease VII large subunit
MENQPLSLFQLMGMVKTDLKEHFPLPHWLVAEISELKVNYNGHCYLELIEKDPSGEAIRARARATIWAAAWRMIRPYFETTAGTTLTAGIKVMVRASVEFHEQYGLSLNITDIEPGYTLGDLARRKQEVINRLKNEGVFDMNRELSLALLPSRIAVISSKTAAGFGDFMHQLTENAFGYRFYIKLFAAVMQGEEAEASVAAALDRIYAYEEFFDAVVLIRGGGAKADLDCFNSYWLASHICQFPLPVLTGIGHEQDETVADLVAHTRLKTPTAVAEFLIGLFREADEHVSGLSYALTEAATTKVNGLHNQLEKLALTLKPAVTEALGRRKVKLERLGNQTGIFVRKSLVRHAASCNRQQDRLAGAAVQSVQKNRHRLELLGNRTHYLDPFQILKRGYSVTYFRGKAVKDPNTVPPDSEITSKLANGIMKSKTT